MTPGKAGVAFVGDLAVGYRAALWARSAVRVLARVGAPGELDPTERGGDEVYGFVRKAADWPSLLAPGQTFAVDARVWSCTDVPSSMLAATRAKDAVCDAIADVTGARPVPPEGGYQRAHLPLFLALHKDRATLYRDLSGQSLHKRGYRADSAIHKAALREDVAAGILTLAGWPARLAAAANGEGPPPAFVDPLAGSGALAIEAALMARKTAPGLLRLESGVPFPFESWPDFDERLFARLVEEAEEAELAEDRAPRVLANELRQDAARLLMDSARVAGVERVVDVTVGDVADYRPALSAPLVVTNPPWGRRLDNGGTETGLRELEETWFQLGLFIREACGGGEAHVLSGSKTLPGKLFLTVDGRAPVTVGGVECRLLRYSVRDKRNRREGGRRDRKARQRGHGVDDDAAAAPTDGVPRSRPVRPRREDLEPVTTAGAGRVAAAARPRREAAAASAKPRTPRPATSKPGGGNYFDW